MKLFFDPTRDMDSHIGVIYAITRNLSPDIVLEIGIRGGVSTKALMSGMLDGGSVGEYHGCDISDRVARPNIYSKSFFHIMSSDALALQWNKPIDILFIDGSHEYEQVKRDFLNFSKFVNINGFIFFHDTYPPEERYKSPTLCGTAYKIIDDLRTDPRIESITLPYSFGLTICRKIQ